MGEEGRGPPLSNAGRGSLTPRNVAVCSGCLSLSLVSDWARLSQIRSWGLLSVVLQYVLACSCFVPANLMVLLRYSLV